MEKDLPSFFQANQLGGKLTILDMEIMRSGEWHTAILLLSHFLEGSEYKVRSLLLTFLARNF